jgi:WD40 repeat protein
MKCTAGTQVRCAQLSHGTIVSGSLDNTIKIWDLKTGKCKDTLFGHTGGM